MEPALRCGCCLLARDEMSLGSPAVIMRDGRCWLQSDVNSDNRPSTWSTASLRAGVSRSEAWNENAEKAYPTLLQLDDEKAADYSARPKLAKMILLEVATEREEDTARASRKTSGSGELYL